MSASLGTVVGLAFVGLWLIGAWYILFLPTGPHVYPLRMFGVALGVVYVVGSVVQYIQYRRGER